MIDRYNFKIIPSEVSEKTKFLKRAFYYLYKQKDPVEIVNDQVSYEALFYIKTVLNDENYLTENTNWEFFMKTNFYKILVRLLTYLSDISDTLTVEEGVEIHEDASNPNTSLNERQLSILSYCVLIANRLADIYYKDENLFEFSKKLIRKGIIESLFSFLRREKYSKLTSDHYDAQDQIIGIIATIRNFSENSYIDKKVWKNAEAEEKLKNYVDKTEYKGQFVELMDEIILNINQKPLNECLENLIKLDEPSVISQNLTAYHDFYFIKEIFKKPIFKDYYLFMKYDMCSLFERLLVFYYEKRDELNFENVRLDKDSIKREPYAGDLQLSILYFLLLTLNELIFRSVEMNIYFGNIKLVKALAAFLNSEFINAPNEDKKEILLLLIKNLSILSRWSEDNKKEWNDLNLVETFLNLINVLKDVELTNKEEMIISAYYTIGNIADDKQIEVLPEINFVIERLLDELVNIANLMDSDSFIEKVKIQVIDDDRKIETWHVSYSNRTLTGTLYGLTRFAVNHNTKNIIFEKSSALETIILKGNDIEKLMSLKLLAQLCFDEEIANKVLNNHEFCKFIQDLSITSSHKDVKKVSHDLIWYLNQSISKIENKHVMISYNPSNRKALVELKEELEKAGINSWIDIDHLNGSSIDECIKAIQDTQYFIIGVSEKYRLSERCQVEAQYAVKMNRIIIPVIVQAGYENVDGWLGRVIKDKPYVNLVNNGLESSIQELTQLISIKKEESEPIEETKEPEQISLPEPLVDEEPIKVDSPRTAEKWTAEEVSKWFIDNNISMCIRETYADVDGFTLMQLYLLKTSTPEFFFQCLRKETHRKITTADIALFIGKLDMLFKYKLL